MSTVNSNTIVTRSLPAGYTARPAVLSDLAAVVTMVNASTRSLRGVDQHSVAVWSGYWTSPAYQLATNTQVVQSPRGDVAGFANLWDVRPHTLLKQWTWVHPDHTRLGLGNYLLRWVENRAWECAALAPQGSDVTLVESVHGYDFAAQSLLRAHGHEHVRTSWRMVIDLDITKLPAQPTWPPGVSVRCFVPGQDDRVTLQVIRTAFRDQWGSVEQPFEEDLQHWTHNWRHDPDFDHSLWFLAVAESDVIGTALCSRQTTEDPAMAWISAVSVQRSWRKRGIASALLRHCFLELWQRGLRKVGLSVDVENLTNALHLYEEAGMRPDPAGTFQTWQRVLKSDLDGTST